MLRIQRIFIESCLTIMLLLTLFLLLSVTATGQQLANSQIKNDEIASRKANEPMQPKAAITNAPVYTGFMGVTIGMEAQEVREKLGHLANKGEHQDLFVFSESQSAQVFYDQGKVSAISVDYVKSNEAPSPESVLGEAVQPRPDGSMYQLKRYPEAGYWVAFSRTAGENPIVSVTMQKI